MNRATRSRLRYYEHIRWQAVKPGIIEKFEQQLNEGIERVFRLAFAHPRSRII